MTKTPIYSKKRYFVQIVSGFLRIQLVENNEQTGIKTGIEVPEIRRYSGGLVVWWSGGLVVWWSGGLVVWWSGGLVVWWSGGLVVWWSGGLVVWWSGGLTGWVEAFVI